jgi:hypothetical protein
MIKPYVEMLIIEYWLFYFEIENKGLQDLVN